jgi:uncharacterized Zn-binding protein involved in type VI secretion
MARQVIVVSDTLAPHGGTVTTGSNADIVDGKPLARKGDTVECREHGTQTIAEGDGNGMFDSVLSEIYKDPVAGKCPSYWA